MTRRARLARLEDRRRDSAPGDMLGIFAADAGAGLWREVDGGRTLPLDPDALAGAAVGVLFHDPRGGSKVIAGIDGWAV